jgi:predicted RNase H-like HicB family nuclease
MGHRFTAIVEREGDGYVSLCPELDIASQGDTVEEARDNLKEALELFFDSASEEEVRRRAPSQAMNNNITSGYAL